MKLYIYIYWPSLSTSKKDILKSEDGKQHVVLLRWKFHEIIFVIRHLIAACFQQQHSEIIHVIRICSKFIWWLRSSSNHPWVLVWKKIKRRLIITDCDLLVFTNFTSQSSFYHDHHHYTGFAVYAPFFCGWGSIITFRGFTSLARWLAVSYPDFERRKILTNVAVCCGIALWKSLNQSVEQHSNISMYTSSYQTISIHIIQWC